MVNLTHTEAGVRSASISVDSYDVELDLTLGEQFFSSRSTVEFTSRDQQSIFLEIEPQSLHSIRLNGRPVDVDSWHAGRVHLSPDRQHNVVAVEATMTYSHDGEGLHRYVDPLDGQVYTYAMCFLDAAPRVFGCFDQPDLKAPYRLKVRTPDNWVALGNGPARNVGRGRWEIVQALPLATYFVTVVAGPYHVVRDTHDGIPLSLASRASLAEHLDRDAAEMFRTTAQAFDEFHRLFEISYPFGEYHQAFVPEFNAAAMENPGCVTFRDQMIFDSPPTDEERAHRARVIVHEMAHQWFGDLVTMRWWDDLWLNESFAEYMAYRVTADATDFDDAWLEFTHSRKAWGIRADMRRSTHPVTGSPSVDARSALSNFDGISYAKGTAVLKQLVAYLGDGPFLAGVRDHLTQHTYRNATFADITGSWSAAAADDGLADWVTVWLRTTGIDVIEATANEGRPAVSVKSSSPDRLRPHAISVTQLTPEPRTTALVLRDRAELDPSPGPVIPDSGDDTWAKIRLDLGSIDVVGTLTALDDAGVRSVIWAALRESVYDAVLDPAEWLRICTAALPDEDSDLAVDSVFGSLLRARGTYVSTADADDQLLATALTLLESATAGSNRQLTAARCVLAVATDSDVVRRWTEGRLPAGLEPSTDLSWRVMYRLVLNGDATVDAIEKLLEGQASDSAVVWAHRCRAAVPDAAGKNTAWQTIVSDPDISNHKLYALCEGFWQPGQDKLIDPYVERFFEEIPSTSDLRSGWIVGETTRLAYPRYAVRAETADLADRLVDDLSVSARVRRSVSDGTDDLRQVMRSRERYATSHED
jgi:aminopeptidase N